MLIRIRLHITGRQDNVQLENIARHERVRRIGIALASDRIAERVRLKKWTGRISQRAGCVGEGSFWRSCSKTEDRHRNASQTKQKSGEYSRMNETCFGRTVPFHIL